MKLEIQMDAKKVVIPDLWHVAMHLGADTPEGKIVLETWHLAHDMRNALAALQVEEKELRTAFNASAKNIAEIKARSIEHFAAVFAAEEHVLSPGKRHRQRAEKLLNHSAKEES